MAACGSVIASSKSFEISSCYSGSSPTKDKEESLSKYLSTSGSKFVWLGSFQDLISFAVQHLDLNLENSKVSENDNRKAIKANHLILNFYESTGTLQVQGPQATTYKAILNDLTIGADERNLNSRHLVNTNNMNDDQTETGPASAEVSALVDLSDNIVTSLEFSREIEKIWSEITSIRNRFGFLEKPREDDVNNAQLINTLRQKNQDLCQEICMLKERLLEETSKLKKISEERDSYRTALQIMSKELNTNLNQREGNSNADNQGDRHCNQLAQDQVSDFQEVKSKKKKRKTQSSKHTQGQIEGEGTAGISRERDQQPESPTPSDTTVIIGDSIIKGLRRDLLSRAAKQRVTVRSFPGATATDMKHYLQPSIATKPREMILHIGTNDLKHHSPRVVAEQIVDLGNLVSSSSPDTKVTISALTQRYDEASLGDKVKDCNKVIKTFCNQNGWGFVKHPNIDETCVNNQKLHLNKKGIAILASNLVSHITH